MRFSVLGPLAVVDDLGVSVGVGGSKRRDLLLRLLIDANRVVPTAVLIEDLTSPRGKRQFRRGVLDAASGEVTSYGPPASHHLRWLASANCLLEIDEDVAEVPAGSQVLVWDLSVG